MIASISIHHVSSDDCKTCRSIGTNRFACNSYNSFQFCNVQNGKWVAMGSILKCDGDQVCSIKGESPCVNATDTTPSSCRQVCTRTCGKLDLYTCTDKGTFQICAASPPIRNVACPNGQVCTENFCKADKEDGVDTIPSCSSDITKIDLLSFCDDKRPGKFLNPNDEKCVKFIECAYNEEAGKLVGTEGTDSCPDNEQFSEKFGQCIAKRQDGCPALPTVDGNPDDKNKDDGKSKD